MGRLVRHHRSERRLMHLENRLLFVIMDRIAAGTKERTVRESQEPR
jgi:hypothetical protein